MSSMTRNRRRLRVARQRQLERYRADPKPLKDSYRLLPPQQLFRVLTQKVPANCSARKQKCVPSKNSLRKTKGSMTAEAISHQKVTLINQPGNATLRLITTRRVTLQAYVTIKASFYQTGVPCGALRPPQPANGGIIVSRITLTESRTKYLEPSTSWSKNI
jgi:hypothetical protein